jgi:hypothetical protein
MKGILFFVLLFSFPSISQTYIVRTIRSFGAKGMAKQTTALLLRQLLGSLTRGGEGKLLFLKALT